MNPRLFHFILTLGIAAAAFGLAVFLTSSTALSHPITSAVPVDGASSAGHNLLINPDFEDGYTYALTCCKNIAVPLGWNIRWYTDTAIVIDDVTYKFKQPEVKLIDNTQWPFCDGCAPNIPPRVHSGRYAVDAFVLFAPQDTTLYQQVGHIPVGAVVTGTAWLQAWVSSCNPFPQNATIQLPAISLQGHNDAENEYQCPADFWPTESTHMMVGIDPYGGTDPRASSVTWNWDKHKPAWWGPYDTYSSTLPVVVTARAYTVTFFLRGVTQQPTRYDDVYFDAASLTASFPLEWQIDQAQEWPLSTSITITLQVPLSLTQVSAALQDPLGQLSPIEPLGSSPTAPYTLAWRFTPHSAGSYRFTLIALELPDPLVKAIEVQALPFSTEQNQLFPSTPTDTVAITYALSSPIMLTDLSALVSDAQNQALSTTWVLSDFTAGRYLAVGTFNAKSSGWHTITLNATEFMQPYEQRVLVASARVYLPLVLRN